MTKIYVVFEAEGEYSDHSEWAVCAYTKEEDAKAHVEKAAEIAIDASRENGISIEYSNKPEHTALLTNKYDPEASTYRDYTGRNYYIVETELRDVFEEIK